MMMPRYINTHCALRLGDNLAHLHFLRALAKANPDAVFTHRAQAAYIPQLADVVSDLPNIQLTVLNPGGVPINSIDAWKNSASFWDNHPLKNDYGPFFLDFFARMARRMGLEPVFSKPSDLLFDYPALRPPNPIAEPFDFLVVNSPPLSGQFRGYDEEQLAELVGLLARRFKVVTTHRCRVPITCTTDRGLSVTLIGHLSQCCKYIVMVSTGPSWPTFNIWNTESIKLRVVLIDSERVDLAPNTIQTNKISAVRDILISKGIL